MGNASYFSLELHSAPLPVHPFPLPCTAVSIPFTEERQTLLTCLFAPVAALDIFWSLIYGTHFLVFHPGFFGRQSSLSPLTYFVMMELPILTTLPYLSMALIVSVSVG